MTLCVATMLFGNLFSIAAVRYTPQRCLYGSVEASYMGDLEVSLACITFHFESVLQRSRMPVCCCTSGRKKPSGPNVG